MIKYRSILFQTEMVQAILNGTKNQTRRILKPQPKEGYTANIYKGNDMRLHLESRKSKLELECIDWSVLQPGTILWVRETFHNCTIAGDELCFLRKADFSNDAASLVKWKPSIHMPKEACRLFLKTTSIRVERLKDISCEDCKNEGVVYFNSNDENVDDFLALESFMALWEKINGPNSWLKNPWVWVINFEKIEKPEGWPL